MRPPRPLPAALSRVRPYVRPHRAPLIMVVLLGVLGAAMSATEPLVMKWLFDEFLASHTFTRPLRPFLLLAALLLVTELVTGARDWLAWRVRLGIDFSLLRAPSTSMGTTSARSSSGRCAIRSAWCSRRVRCSATASATTSRSAGPRRRSTTSSPRPRRPTLTSSSPRSRTATTRRWASAAPSCPAASASASPSRALLKDAPILVLDEATSALDAESEEKVQEALARLTQGRTTFVIAHRLSTVTSADRIAVFREGRIAELGTHEQLMREGGYYASLVARQLRGLAGDLSA